MADENVITSAGAATRTARYATELFIRLKRDPRTIAAAEDCRQTFSAMRTGRSTPKESATTVRARIQALVLDECALPYQWLVELILHEITAQLTGAGDESVTLDAPTLSDIPKGRAPKRGDYQARDIDWFFRNRVLRESAYAIAKADLGRIGKGHHTVQKAIARVTSALDTLDVDAAC